MAMISCPNCGEQISDKAKTCVHCGAVLVPEEKVFCLECGAEIKSGATVCQKCGCPVEALDQGEKAQAVEVTGVKITSKSKKMIMIGLLIAAAVIVTIFAVTQVQKKKAADAAKAAQESEAAAAEEALANYSTNYELAVYSMLSGAGDAETCGNLIKQVWYNAINKESDSSTDKYTRPNGYYVSDFNDALKNLFSDSSFTSQISSIEDNQDTVNSLMKELKNPPEKYEDAYDSLSEFYDAYLSLTNLATDPTGSLQTFSSNFNDADSETLKCYEAVKLYLEE